MEYMLQECYPRKSAASALAAIATQSMHQEFPLTATADRKCIQYPVRPVNAVDTAIRVLHDSKHEVNPIDYKSKYIRRDACGVCMRGGQKCERRVYDTSLHQRTRKSAGLVTEKGSRQEIGFRGRKKRTGPLHHPTSLGRRLTHFHGSGGSGVREEGLWSHAQTCSSGRRRQETEDHQRRRLRRSSAGHKLPSNGKKKNSAIREPS